MSSAAEQHRYPLRFAPEGCLLGTATPSSLTRFFFSFNQLAYAATCFRARSIFSWCRRSRAAASARRHDQSARGIVAGPFGLDAGYSVGRRVRRARPLHCRLVRLLRAQGHTARRYRQAQCRDGAGTGRSGDAGALRPARASMSPRATSRRRKASPHFKTPKWTSGGRSSKPPGSEGSSS
jgi:hypothetical protein